MVSRSQPTLLPSRYGSSSGLMSQTALQSNPSWRNLGSGKDLNPTEFPSPASSEYHLPLSTRPKSAGMSHFTARENRRLEYRSDLKSAFLSPTAGAEGVSTSRLRSPTDKDFQRVLDKLQKLQSGKVGGHKLILSDAKDEELIMEADEMQFFKINCVGRPCPLKVTIEREKGSLVVYMSRTVQEPMEGEAEAVYKKDEFVISDPGLRFKTAYLYLGAKALNESIFTIALKYGKRSTLSEANFRGRQEAALEEEARLEELKNILKPKLQAVHNNFIKRNLQIASPTANAQRKAIKLKRRQAEERRQAVLMRKQSVLESKRQRTYLVLHRHELRKQAEAKAQEILDLIFRKETYEKAWLTLLFDRQAIQTLEDKFTHRKAELELARKRNRAATLIQVFVRKQLRHLDRTGLALRAARNSVLLYARLMFRPVRRTAKSKIVRVIKQAFKNSILPMAAARMCRRMELIKKVWRAYLERKKNRWEQLNSLWVSCLEEIIRELNKPVKAKRPVRKKKDPTIKYMEIPIALKMQALTGVILGARRRFRDRVRTYLSSQHELIRMGVKAFQSTAEGSDGILLALPEFTFLPTREEMKGLIDKAAGVTSPKKSA